MKLPRYRSTKLNPEDKMEFAYVRESILTSLLVDVAEVFNVQLRTIQSGNKEPTTVLVRTIFYYVARTKTEYSTAPMAKVAGRKDHSCCVRHLQMVEDCFKDEDQEFLSLWNQYLSNSKLFTENDF